VLEDLSMITCRLACTIEEWVRALRLVYQVYQQAGLWGSNRYQLRVTPYHLLPSSDVFIAAEQATVVASATLVRDGLLGIPAEMVYQAEIREHRSRKRVFGEITCLAMNRGGREELGILLGLLRLVLQYARFTEHLDEVFFAVHPRQMLFYQRMLGFEAISEIREGPGQIAAPMVLLVLDMTSLQTKHPRANEILFGTRLPPEQLWPTRLPLDQRRLLEPFVDRRFFPVPLAADWQEGEPVYGASRVSSD